MFYSMYLSSLCGRRSWPEPLYEPYTNRHGHFCKVRVNNREYCTDVPYESEALARDGAAMKAYMICRNFSHNDGMYPGQKPGHRSSNGIVQGLPVAIGTGRRSNRNSGSSYTESTTSEETSSGGNSPRSIEGGFEQQLASSSRARHSAAPQFNHRGAPGGRRGAPRVQAHEYICMCGMDRVARYGRCFSCCRANGWM